MVRDMSSELALRLMVYLLAIAMIVIPVRGRAA